MRWSPGRWSNSLIDSHFRGNEEKLTLSSPYSLKDRLLFALVGLLGPWLIRLLGILCRYRVEGGERLDNAIKSGQGLIIAAWHGRMLLPIYHLRNRDITSLVSFHRDGELITRVVTRLGYVIRRGSPRKGGREGFLTMSRDIREGRAVSIFPDGPTGPRYNLRDGVIHLSRMTGAPIFPLTYSARPCWRVKSWDRFMIMKPFSRGIILVGDPIAVPREVKSDEEFDRYRDLVIDAMISLEREADRRMGVKEEIRAETA